MRAMEAGNLELAGKLLRETKNSYSRNQAFGEYAARCYREGRTDLEIDKWILAPYDVLVYAGAGEAELLELVRTASEMGHFEDAQRLADNSKFGNKSIYWSSSLLEIAWGLIREKRIEEGLAVARRLPPSERNGILDRGDTPTAIALHNAGETEMALSFLKECTGSAGDWCAIVCKISHDLPRERANQLIEEAKLVSIAANPNNKERKWYHGWPSIAEAYAYQGDAEAAGDALQKAMEQYAAKKKEKDATLTPQDREQQARALAGENADRKKKGLPELAPSYDRMADTIRFGTTMKIATGFASRGDAKSAIRFLNMIPVDMMQGNAGAFECVKTAYKMNHEEAAKILLSKSPPLSSESVITWLVKRGRTDEAEKVAGLRDANGNVREEYKQVDFKGLINAGRNLIHWSANPPTRWERD